MNQIVENKCLTEEGLKREVTIGSYFKKVVNKFWYKDQWEKDINVIRFMSEYGWLDPEPERTCLKCVGEKRLTRKHIADECPMYQEWRYETLKQIGKVRRIGNLEKKNNAAEKWLLECYFNPIIPYEHKVMITVQKRCDELYKIGHEVKKKNVRWKARKMRKIINLRRRWNYKKKKRLERKGCKRILE